MIHKKLYIKKYIEAIQIRYIVHSASHQSLAQNKLSLAQWLDYQDPTRSNNMKDTHKLNKHMDMTYWLDFK